MGRFQTVESATLPGAPTRRSAERLAAAGITSEADLDAWLLVNVTNIAQARVVLREIIIALVQLSTDGEPSLPPGNGL